MKTKIHFLIVLCGVFFLQAKGQNKECEETTAEISTLLKDAKFTEAFDAYSNAGKCAYASELALQDGEKILNYKIEAATTDAEKADAISGLFKLYETYDKNFPKNTNSNLSKKAKLLYDSKLGTTDEVYTLLDNAFKGDPANFSDAASLYLYFDLYLEKFKASEKGITEDDVLIKYDAVANRLENKIQPSPADVRSYETASNGLKSLVSPYSTCEKLGVFYNKYFESKKTDSIWLQRASQTLMDKKCTTTPLFLKIATENYALKATSNSAYHLGVANLKNRDQKKAIELFEMAASLEKNANQKASIYYNTASILFLDKAKSLDYLKKAIAAKPDFGKAYLLMAQIYAESPTCAKTPFERKVLYLLAAETAKKSEVDASFKKSSISLYNSYIKKGPTKQEISAEKMSGKRVNFGCYINESVLIP